MRILVPRPLAIFAVGDTIAGTGIAMTSVALPLLILAVGGTSVEVGIVLAARTIPSLVLLPLGGLIADRVPRRIAMLCCNFIQLVGVLVLAVSLSAQEVDLPLAICASFFIGLADAFFLPAAAAIVPELSADYGIERTNALLTALQASTRVVGPLCAGVIIAVWSPVLLIYATSLAYAASFVSILLIPTIGRRVARDGAPRAIPHPASNARPQQKWFLTKTFGPTALMILVFNMCLWGPYQALGPPMVTARWGLEFWPWAVAFYGAGAVTVGFVIAALRTKPVRSVRVVAVTSLVWCAPVVVLVLGSPWPLYLFGALIGGVASGCFNVFWSAFIQRTAPAARLAQVVSIVTATAAGGLSVGVLMAPLLSLYFGQSTVLGAGVIAHVVACAALIVYNTYGRRLAARSGERSGI